MGIDWKAEFPDIKHILFDKDNTLTLPHKSQYFSSEIEESVKNAKAHFPVSILSNSAGSSDDPGFETASRMSKSLQVPVIKHGGRKPLIFDEVMAHVNKDTLNHPLKPD